METIARLVLSTLALYALLGCFQRSRLPAEADIGAEPKLPEPTRSLVPMVQIAPATGWPARATPTAAPGLAVDAFADGLDHPRLVRFLYVEGATRITEPAEKVVDLPGGPLNHHWTKNVIASPDGSRLYVTVGSNSNVAEHGMMENEVDRAAILEVDPEKRTRKLYASGLRNPNGLDREPQTGTLWTVVNERDEIGSDLVPDYLTSVQEGGFYGWPYSYYAKHVDARVEPQRSELVERPIVPDYALGAHVAALGLTFYEHRLLGDRYTGGAFIGEHGSWNRRPLSGYKVVFVEFENGRPVGLPQDILTAFVDTGGDARGRPAGVAVDRAGALLVADDVGNTIWRVTPAQR